MTIPTIAYTARCAVVPMTSMILERQRKFDLQLLIEEQMHQNISN